MASNDEPLLSFPDDLLPPEGQYNSRDAVYSAINNWASTRGYAFAIQRSQKSVSGRITVIFSCDRGAGRRPASSIERKRETSSRRTGCQFSVIAKESLDKTNWSLKWRIGDKYNQHNHEPSRSKLSHPTYRQLSTVNRSLVHNLSAAGIAPREIRSYLHTNTGAIATQSDINNCIAQGKRELAQGQSTIHALANELDKEGFWNRMQLDDEGRVTAVLFAHPKSLAYIKTYPDLLIMDCTYKTNKYKMPQLDIVGVDACQRTFCVAFAFLSGEEESDYIWALERLRQMYELCGARLPSVIFTDRDLACMNAISICFPDTASLLCQWHINQAVLQNCVKAFTDNPSYENGFDEWKVFNDKWNELVASSTEEVYNTRLQDFKKYYIPKHVEQVGYILEQWLEPYKERFVKAWVNQHLHFDNYVTSRVEGIHNMIKTYMKTSQLDLFQAWRSIKLVLLNQLTELEANQAKQQIRTPLELSGSLYGHICGWVSHEGLRKVEAQRKRLLNDLPHCTGVFTMSLGLPCAHTIQDLISQERPLLLDNIHPHWYLQRLGTPDIMIEPRRQVDRLAARSTKPQSSTQREASGFEAVAAAIKPRAKPKCSNCHNEGHIRTSKVCPLRFAYLLESSTTTGSPPTTAATAATTATAAITSQPSTVYTTTQTTTQTVTRSITRSLSPVLSTTIVHTSSHMTTTSSTSLMLTGSTATTATNAITTPAFAYSHPCAIYERYRASREAWYSSQPRGSLKTNQQYRKAMGLPTRFSKAEYEWCRDYKQMGKTSRSSNGPPRDWTKEEMMSYIDWDKAEDQRVEGNVAEEMAGGGFSARRGMQDIWDAAERDIQAQGIL